MKKVKYVKVIYKNPHYLVQVNKLGAKELGDQQKLISNTILFCK